jgi:hypothetical protein
MLCNKFKFYQDQVSNPRPSRSFYIFILLVIIKKSNKHFIRSNFQESVGIRCLGAKLWKLFQERHSNCALTVWEQVYIIQILCWHNRRVQNFHVEAWLKLEPSWTTLIRVYQNKLIFFWIKNYPMPKVFEEVVHIYVVKGLAHSYFFWLVLFYHRWLTVECSSLKSMIYYSCVPLFRMLTFIV